MICTPSGDEDFYRVGPFTAETLITARLRHDSLQGRLGLVIARASADLSALTYVVYDPNTGDADELEIAYLAPAIDPAFAREYVVIVRGGDPALAVQPYAIDIEVAPQ